MPTKRDIDDFLAQRKIAFVGVSRNSKKFSNTVYLALKQRGYQLYPINAHADQLEGDRCYRSLAELPEKVDGAMIMVPPAASEDLVRQCSEAGIRRVWLGQGAVSAEAVRYGHEKGIALVDGACPMMFAEPVSFGHRCHRFVKQITGSLPK
jgi:predicted CoA-binding protein